MLAVVCFACVLGYAPVARAFLYWGASGAIGRANIDGSGVDPSFITFGGVTPGSIAVDSSRIYWAQFTTGVERANLNGTGLNSNFFGGGGAEAVAVNASNIYWSQEPGIGGITRANIDGSGVNQSFITNVAPPCSGCSVRATVLGVAVDAQHVYWASFRTNSTTFQTIATIGRANLDGSSANPGFITLPVNYEPVGLAVDGQHLYWSYGTGSTQGIGSANTSGSGVNLNLISVPGFGVGGIALDSSHIYWAEAGGGSGPSAIGRANLDGSSAKLSFITGLSGASAVAVDQSSPTITISGTVRTFQGGNPETRGLIRARVSIDGTDHNGAAVHLTASTNATGAYQFPALPDGIYTVAPKGDPPAQDSPRDDPPPGGRYVATACDGTMSAGACQIITAIAPPGPVADFAYGQDHRLTIAFSPAAVPGDGFGQGTVGITDATLGRSPVGGQWLWGRIRVPQLDGGGNESNVHFLLCGTAPGTSSDTQLIYPTSGLLAAHLKTTDPRGGVQAAVYVGSAGDATLRVREPALNDDIQVSLQGNDPVPGSLTFAKPVLGTLSAPVPGSSGFRHLDGLLDSAIRSVGVPAGLDAAPPVVAQRLLLDWLVAVKRAGMLPGIDFGPISTNPTITAPRSHPAILFYPSGDTGIVDPRVIDPLLDTGQAGAVGEVLDIPTMFALVSGSFKHALPTFNQWLAGLKIPVTDAGELQPLDHGAPDDRVYWGWPYPPPATTPGAALYYRCTGLALPSLQRVVVHSPVRLLITGAHGRTLGYTRSGRFRHTLPGSS